MEKRGVHQEKSLHELLSFGAELMVHCMAHNIHPIVYGSLAYVVHTGDSDMVVHDIDFLIPLGTFGELIAIVQDMPDCVYEETNYRSIKVYRGSMKVSFDSIEDYLAGIPFQTQSIHFNGYPLEVVDTDTLVEVYRRGAATIPAKSEQYAFKLRVLRGG